jgi:hypothetical protein
MYDASGGSNLSVVVGCNILHQKVHQPPPLLKYGEDADDFSFGLIAGYRDRHGLGCVSFRALRLRSLPSVHEDYHEQSQRDNQRGSRKI